MPQTSQATSSSTATANAPNTHTTAVPSRSSLMPSSMTDQADYIVLTRPRAGDREAITAARAGIAEIIALSDPGSTPQRVFDALRVAHDALTDALEVYR